MCEDLRWRNASFVTVVGRPWYEFAHDVYPLAKEEPVVKYGPDEAVLQILPTEEE